jgi:hypothetical protein
MKKISFLTCLLLIIILAPSCKKTLPDVGQTAAVSMANEWWVTLDLGAQKDVYGIGHFKIATYNSAANDNFLWIDDFKNGYGFKSKVTADFSALTFSSAKADNLYYVTGSTAFPQTVKITEGKIFPGLGHSKSGNVTDSIYMKVEFSDDPGKVYSMPGTARTRFTEDEY